MTEESYENGENTERVRYNQEVSVQGRVGNLWCREKCVLYIIH